MVFQKGLCELRASLCTQSNPTFDYWTHYFPFLRKPTWKQKQNRKIKWLNWIYFELFSILKPKTEDIFSHLCMMFLRRQMKHVNALVRKDQQNEEMGSQICCRIRCTGLSTSSITGAHPIMSKVLFLLLGFEVRLFWQSSAEHALTSAVEHARVLLRVLWDPGKHHHTGG